MKNIAISGIHTDAGKSCASAALCQAFSYKYFKLIQAGEQTDLAFIQNLVPNLSFFPPAISLKTAASPHLGMKIENLKFNGLNLKIPAKNGVLVELAGGLFTPLDSSHFMIDFLKQKNLPTFLVARNYLGMINHTMLSIEALKARKIEILGLIISGEKNESNEEFLRAALPELPIFYLPDFSENGFESAASELKTQILNSRIKL